MTGTITNVAIGSGLKILAVILGKLVDGYFRDKKENRDAISNKRKHFVEIQSGADDASDHARVTRRFLAWMFGFTACFVIALFALDANDIVPILTDKERGIFGWVFGGKDQTVVEVTKAQMIMQMWSLLEILFGFYFTKIDSQRTEVIPLPEKKDDTTTES